MKKIIFLFCIALATNVSAQKVLLEENVEDTTKTTKTLIKKYFGGTFAWGYPVGADAQINHWNSPTVAATIYYGKRFTNYLGYTVYGRYASEKYSINQNLVDDEYVIFNQFGLGLGFRVYAGKRKHKKKFIEFSGYADYITGSRLHFEDNTALSNGVDGNRYESITHKPHFINDLNYGGIVRIAGGTLALFGKYRAVNLMDNTSPYTQFTPYTVGLEIGL